jgi:hypothetical protein
MNESCVVIVPSPVHSSQRPPLTLKLKVEAVKPRFLAWSVSENNARRIGLGKGKRVCCDPALFVGAKGMTGVRIRLESRSVGR